MPTSASVSMSCRDSAGRTHPSQREAGLDREGGKGRSVPSITRAEWIASVKARIEPVGECMEWTGPVRGTVPVVYAPLDYAWPGNSMGRQSVRSVLYTLSTGERLPAGTLIRAKCRNILCVHEDHWQLFTRREQAAEQGRRGELSTAKRCAARAKAARERSPLTLEKVEAIRLSGRPSAEEALAHGVSKRTIDAIRSGRRWRESVRGASVFSWGGSA